MFRAKPFFNSSFILLLFLGVIFFSTPVQAAIHTYNFLFNGTVTTYNIESDHDTVTSVNGVLINFSFDTDDTVAPIPVDEDDPSRYIFNTQDISCTIDGNSWRQYVPFSFDTYLTIEKMDDGGLAISMVSYVNTDNGYFIMIQNADLEIWETDDAGEYGIEVNFREDWYAFPYGTCKKNDEVTVEGTLRLNAVPIPGAAWLLGFGLIGLVGLRREQKA